ncbi:cytochrome P450 52A11 [Colletotrichum kahawae]|uniref:Cytochrome P450 52A11 n=1 Tax=Colletotrichum kahawae TaxID=34407 RepID=A0AAD9Y9W9_COLKA|nr:cytochrome P450 52A11 [Colletotrichum kahawae]
MEQAGNPPVLFIDFWPLNEPMLLIRNHDVAEQVSKQSQVWPYSLPKSASFKEYLPLVGEHSLIWDSPVEAHGEEVIGQLKYTSAVIKEVLRLHPPAATARYSPQGTGFHLVLPDGSRICADDLMLYNCNYLIHRDPQVYGETKDDFIPERWLDASATDPLTSTKSENSHIPPSSWRPFERGPRNCIGQELANIEAKVILVVLVGRYDFVKEGLGSPVLGANGEPFLNAKGRHMTESDVYNVILQFAHLLTFADYRKSRQITAQPVDGMRVRAIRRTT